MAYSKGGTVWFADAQSSSIHGQWITHTGLPSAQTYTYDGLGRLTNVVDDSSSTDGCVQRTYAFANTAGLNSNRSSLVTNPAAENGTCQTATSTTQTLTYDTADRLKPTGPAVGLVYDTFGRIATLPGALAGSTAATVTNGYYSNDLVASQSTTSPARTKTWQLDATLQRYRTFTDNITGSTVTSTNHYTSSAGDSPAWVDEGNGSSTRNTSGLDGNLGALTSYTNSTGVVSSLRFQLANLHGDIVTTSSASASTYDGPVMDTDEYGSPKPSNTSAARYGWLGGQQRSADTLGGLALMGVRLYSPFLGRFLSVDPVVGGSANAYDYVNQDPINSFDLDGRRPVGSDDCACPVVTRTHKVVSFFSGRSYIQGVNQLLHGHPLTAARTILFGQGPAIATNEAFKRRGRHEAVGAARRLLLRMLTWQAMIPATALDYGLSNLEKGAQHERNLRREFGSDGRARRERHRRMA